MSIAREELENALGSEKRMTTLESSSRWQKIFTVFASTLSLVLIGAFVSGFLIIVAKLDEVNANVLENSTRITSVEQSVEIVRAEQQQIVAALQSQGHRLESLENLFTQ